MEEQHAGLCPECSGDGLYYHLSGWYEQTITEYPCSACEGVGEIEQVPWYFHAVQQDREIVDTMIQDGEAYPRWVTA